MHFSRRLARSAFPLALSAGLLGGLAVAPVSPAVAATAVADAAATNLTPNTNGGGALPSGERLLVFTLADGDWAAKVTLPTKPADGDTVRIVHKASYSSTLVGKTDRATALTTGTTATFVYKASAAVWAVSDSTSLRTSPNALGGGALPSGYRYIEYTLADGDWTAMVTLPAKPANGDTVRIVHKAGYDSTLAGPSLTLTTRWGDDHTFVYNASTGAWTGKELSPSKTGATIPDNPGPHSTYSLTDGDWAPVITLPARAADRSQLVIRSTATWGATISPANILHASTMQIKTGDVYTLEFRANPEAGVDKWVITDAPTRTVAAAGTVPAATSPRTLMTLTGATATVTLPATPADRDRVTIRSQSATPARIVASPLVASGPLTVSKGEEYTLLYVAEKSSWVVLSSPDTAYRLGDLTGGKLPALRTPRTLVSAADGNWGKTLVLPADQPVGSRVVLETTATYAIAVNTGTASIPVSTGETVAFLVGADGAWKRETVTIDYLLLYSDKAAAKFGADSMKKRLTEGFALTNEALENSGANFRLRAVGIREYATPSSWSTLGDVLNKIRTEPKAQAMLNETRADALYYEGTEEGCGLAWLNTTPNKLNMVASGNTVCGVTAMRHEIGHNMGVAHAKDTGYGISRGYEFVSDLLGGNTTPVFSTPNRFDPVTGIAYGIEGKIDSVKAMNALSGTVAGFR